MRKTLFVLTITAAVVALPAAADARRARTDIGSSGASSSPATMPAPGGGTSPSTVPEPGTIGLFGLGIAGIMLGRRLHRGRRGKGAQD